MSCLSLLAIASHTSPLYGVAPSSAWSRYSRYRKTLRPPQRILLTGASGFLGAHILASLLRDTAVDVFCLVRASDEDDGMARLEKSLNRFVSVLLLLLLLLRLLFLLDGDRGILCTESRHTVRLNVRVFGLCYYFAWCCSSHFLLALVFMLLYLFVSTNQKDTTFWATKTLLRQWIGCSPCLEISPPRF